MEKDKFFVVTLGIIYDPKNKKILMGRRENDPYIKELSWCFPGESLVYEKDMEEHLKEEIKKMTGYDVENLGTIFSRAPPEKKDLVLVYHLCEVVGGEEKVGGDFVELKWVSPDEVEKYATTSIHPSVKEYLLNLK